MLPRIRALRTAPVNASLSTALRSGPSRATPAFISSQSRGYASGRKAPPPPSRPAAKRPPPPVEPRNTNAASSSATSSQASQKNAAAAGAKKPIAPGGAGTAAAASNVVSPVQGARTTSPIGEQDPLQKDSDSPQESAAQEPIAQKEDLDTPIAGSARDQAQEGVAASENTPAPESTQQQPASQKPLPDLRQGIPSTFDFEFGGKQQTQSGEKSEGAAGQDDYNPSQSAEAEDAKQRSDNFNPYETSTDRRRKRLINFTFLGAGIAGIGAALYLARPFSESEDLPANFDASKAYSWSPGSLYARVRARMGNEIIDYYTEPVFPKLLPEVPESQRPPFTLVLSLEDLMIHTTWDTKHGYRVAKRPGLDYFIRYLSQYYELVLFTSVPRAIADPVVAKLDPYHFIQWPLGREATKYEKGEYVKDLSYLNRPLNKTLIIDTHAPHVKNQPENAIILPKWKGDVKDPHAADLVRLIPFLEYIATMGIDDVRTVIQSFEGKSIPEEFARREAIARERFNAELAEQRKKAPKFSIGSLAGGLGMNKGMGGGGMVLGDGQSVAEGLAQGKMLSDQIREQGQKQYEYLEKQIRENGEQWLKEEKEEQQRLIDAQMKEMKKGALGWFGSSKE